MLTEYEICGRCYRTFYLALNIFPISIPDLCYGEYYFSSSPRIEDPGDRKLKKIYIFQYDSSISLLLFKKNILYFKKIK